MANSDLAIELTQMQPRLYGYILKRVADREQALDILQRTNLVICEKADTFEAGSSFPAWAFTIARFQVMAWRKREASNRLMFSEKVHELIEDTSGSMPTVDERVPHLKGCLQGLSSEDQSLIQQRYRDGISIHRIANELDSTIGAVTMRLKRIRTKLADCVQYKLSQEVT